MDRMSTLQLCNPSSTALFCCWVLLISQLLWFFESNHPHHQDSSVVNMNFRMQQPLGRSSEASGPAKELNHPNKVIGIRFNEERSQQAPEGAVHGTGSKDGK